MTNTHNMVMPFWSELPDSLRSSVSYAIIDLRRVIRTRIMAKRQLNIIISGEVRCLFSKMVPFFIHKIYRKGVWKVALLATTFWGFVYTKVKIKNL